MHLVKFVEVQTAAILQASYSVSGQGYVCSLDSSNRRSTYCVHDLCKLFMFSNVCIASYLRHYLQGVFQGAGCAADFLGRKWRPHSGNGPANKVS